mmetsp:Transcript_25745/g.40730  ORF Transcript_25745/g.40730 Transcript_25745/m.40730 type:complete len:268 (+) Transcript_25745:1243-2046(+)
MVVEVHKKQFGAANDDSGASAKVHESTHGRFDDILVPVYQLQTPLHDLLECLYRRQPFFFQVHGHLHDLASQRAAPVAQFFDHHRIHIRVVCCRKLPKSPFQLVSYIPPHHGINDLYISRGDIGIRLSNSAQLFPLGLFVYIIQLRTGQLASHVKILAAEFPFLFFFGILGDVGKDVDEQTKLSEASLGHYSQVFVHGSLQKASKPSLEGDIGGNARELDEAQSSRSRLDPMRFQALMDVEQAVIGLLQHVEYTFRIFHQAFGFDCF